MTFINKILGGVVGFITGIGATVLTLPYLYYALARAQVIERQWSWPKSILSVFTLGQVGILTGSPFLLLRALAFPMEGLFFGASRGFRSAFKFPLHLHHEHKNCMVSGHYRAYAEAREEEPVRATENRSPNENNSIHTENEALLRQIKALPRAPKLLTKSELEKFQQMIDYTQDADKKKQLQKELAEYQLYLTSNSCPIDSSSFTDLNDPLTVKVGNKENTYSEAGLKKHIETCTTTFKRLADDPLTRAQLSNKADVTLSRGFAAKWMDFIAEVRQTIKKWVRPEKLPALSREDLREKRSQYYNNQRLFGAKLVEKANDEKLGQQKIKQRAALK